MDERHLGIEVMCASWSAERGESRSEVASQLACAKGMLHPREGGDTDHPDDTDTHEAVAEKHMVW